MPSAINLLPVDRYWFLTWTTYGTWLPGDDRGYVGVTCDKAGNLTNHNVPNTPTAPPNTHLQHHAEKTLLHPEIVLTVQQSAELLTQFQETSQHRGWLMLALGVLHTHIHLLVGVPGDPSPDKILADFKAYGSRRLNSLGTG